MNRFTSDRRAARHPLGAFASGRDGATALEFALVLPLLILVSLGTFETMLLLYDFHRVGEATRQAARAFLIDPPVTGFDALPTTCPGGADCDATKFQAVVDQLHAMAPNLTSSNLRVTISDSGLDVGGPATLVTPIISVSVTNLQYSFKLLHIVAPGVSASIDYPPFETSRIAGTMVQ